MGSGFQKRKGRRHKIVCGGARSGNLLKGLMSPAQSAQIAGLYRYPVKGLSPEPLPAVALEPGQTLPADRRYAIENGPSGFDPAAPQWLSKTYFLMLVRHEWLASLHTHFDDASYVLTIRQNGAIAVQGDLETPDGRAAIEQFFAKSYSRQIKGPPKILSSEGLSFSNVDNKVVSIINLASLRAIEDVAGQPLHPLRFRANLYAEGWPAWHEFDLVGRTLAIGDVRLKVVKRTVRCAAIDVDPETAARDLNLPRTLMQRFGHADCGVYAEAIASGEIAAGDTIMPEAPRFPNS